jgi:hypothetical protein
MKLKSLIDVCAGKQMVPMDRNQMEGFFLCCMMEKDKRGHKPPPDRDMSVSFRIVESRLEAAGILDKVSFPARLFVACLCDRPGLCVMWAYTLAHMLEKSGGMPVTMSSITENFPNGFPSDAQSNECWDAQKGHAHGVKADNLMDNFDWWK